MQTKFIAILAAMALIALCGAPGVQAQEKAKETKGMQGQVKLMTLDPGHFHASLVQKSMYPQVDPVVHVYSNPGADLDQHMDRIKLFNTRPEDPTKWEEKVYTGPDFFQKMVTEKPGNVVVISGNNAKKTEYILGCVKAGLNVLADKPMAITPENEKLLEEAFQVAKKNNVLLYDIMTERYEITTMMQRALSMDKNLFGKLQKGTPEEPAVTKESVHHYFKTVAGKPLVRPAWFYDVTQQGEGIVDVTTHLVDLVQWECFPEKTLKKSDVEMVSAKRWTTKVTPEQFKRSTGMDQYPDFLKKDVKDGALEVYANGAFTYALKGHYAKVSVIWNFEPPTGGGDTHYSIMRGTKANLIIKQGAEQNFKPTLYVENKSGASDEVFEAALKSAVEKVNKEHPGVEFKKGQGTWEIVIPDKYKAVHEQHFGQVTEKYLGFLAKGEMPKWEVPNMIVKYYTTMLAYQKSR